MVIKYSIGLDISAEKFDVNLASIDSEQQVKVVASHKFSNSKFGFDELHKWIQQKLKNTNCKLVVSMEATGVYYENCAIYLFKKCYAVSVVLPNKAKKYLQSTGIKSKNDKVDAKGLARMGAEQSLPIWQPMIEFYYHLRELTRQHQGLQEQRTSLLNQIHANQLGMYVNKMVMKQLKALVAMLDKQIKAIEKAIAEHVNSNTEVATKVKNIARIKGVGVLTIATLIAETNGFSLFTSAAQLVSYSGYDVVENQSGKLNKKTKISKKGNSRIRRALHMPSLGVVMWNKLHL